jgi:hypothetical protein
LIAEGTIEQQILSLHHEKRELVDALLVPARARPVDPSHGHRGVLFVTHADPPRLAALC